MAITKGHKWYDRIYNDRSHVKFVRKWLVSLEKQDLSDPAVGIINGWMSEHWKNQWYADALAKGLSVFAYDTRGQGESPKEGEFNAIQNSIDANKIIGNAFDEFDLLAREKGVKSGNKIIQGNCIGTMAIASLFAGHLPLSKKVDGTILISPVSSFNLPSYLKMTFFVPEWFVRFLPKIAPYFAGKVAGGEDSEESRNEALNRVNKLVPEVAVKQTRQVFWKEDVSKYWKYIDVPSLILVSRNDPLVKLEHSIQPFKDLKYPIWIELKAPDHLVLEDNINYLSEILPEFGRDPWKFYENHKDNYPEP